MFRGRREGIDAQEDEAQAKQNNEFTQIRKNHIKLSVVQRLSDNSKIVTCHDETGKSD